jgi:hypothetical protein
MNYIIFFLKEADIGLGAITVTYERSKAVYFLNPHIITSLSFMTSSPKVVPNLKLIMDPFDYLVWICIIIAFILLFFSSWIISKNLPEIKKFYLHWKIITVFLGQQTSLHLQNISLRIIFGSWLLACFVMVSSYSGCLDSLMAFPSHIKTINTITELLNSQRNGEIKVVVEKNTIYYQSLKV